MMDILTQLKDIKYKMTVRIGFDYEILDHMVITMLSLKKKISTQRANVEMLTNPVVCFS